MKQVTGSLPPLTDASGTRRSRAQQSQYRELNAGMTLAQFKTIFWWEWSHRLLGRFIGVAYPLRSSISLARRGAERKRRLWLIFSLGARRARSAGGWSLPA